MSRQSDEEYYRYLSRKLGIPSELVELKLAILDDACLQAEITELRAATACKDDLSNSRELICAKYRAIIAAAKNVGGSHDQQR